MDNSPIKVTKVIVPEEIQVNLADLPNIISDKIQLMDKLDKKVQNAQKAAKVAEEKAKEDMINSFYMLSEEDKAEVIANKANFSLEDIEAKLSVICVRKKVNFDLEESSKNEDNTETPITTFNVGDSHDATPAWLRAVDAVAKNRK